METSKMERVDGWLRERISLALVSATAFLFTLIISICAWVWIDAKNEMNEKFEKTTHQVNEKYSMAVGQLNEKHAAAMIEIKALKVKDEIRAQAMSEMQGDVKVIKVLLERIDQRMARIEDKTN